MKALANSLKKVAQIIQGNYMSAEFFLVSNVVADDSGALRRTKVKSLEGNVISANTMFGIYNPLMVGVMSVKAHDQLPSEYGLPLLIASSAVTVQMNAVRGEYTDGMSSIEYAVSFDSSLNSEVSQGVSEFDRLMCGTNYYLWVFGGSFQADVLITAVTERVEITQDEYMRYFAGAC